MASLDTLVERMRYWCEEADLGYCQAHRWSIYPGGEADCSSLVIYALREAGFDTGSASYTGDMSESLTRRGWVRAANDGNPQRGDILLNDTHHVAVYLGGGQLAQASRNEFGGASGGQPGDQDGYETNVRSYYNYPWDCYLRYTGAQASASDKLDEDGVWGPATTRALQTQLGTYVDGYIDDQWAPDAYRHEGCTCFRYSNEASGSPCIRAMQRVLGVDADGLCGIDTINALIKHFSYASGADRLDGKLDCPSITIKAMQHRLNEGGF